MRQSFVFFFFFPSLIPVNVEFCYGVLNFFVFLFWYLFLRNTLDNHATWSNIVFLIILGCLRQQDSFYLSSCFVFCILFFSMIFVVLVRQCLVLCVCLENFVFSFLFLVLFLFEYFLASCICLFFYFKFCGFVFDILFVLSMFYFIFHYFVFVFILFWQCYDSFYLFFLF